MNHTKAGRAGRFVIIVILLAGLLTGCGTGARLVGGTGDGTTGMRGKASGKLYSGLESYTYGGLASASIRFYDVKGDEVARVTTSSGGDYDVPLLPGLYTVIPQEYASAAVHVVRHPSPTRIIVHPDKEQLPPWNESIPKPEPQGEWETPPSQTAPSREVAVPPKGFVEVNIDYN